MVNGQGSVHLIFTHFKIISTAGKCSNLNDKQMRFSASSTAQLTSTDNNKTKEKTNKTRHWWRVKEKPMSWYAHTSTRVFVSPNYCVSSIYKSHQPFYEQNSYFLTCCLCCDFLVVVEPAQLMGAWEKGLNNIRHLFSCRVATSYRTPSSFFFKKKKINKIEVLTFFQMEMDGILWKTGATTWKLNKHSLFRLLLHSRHSLFFLLNASSQPICAPIQNTKFYSLNIRINGEQQELLAHAHSSHHKRAARTTPMEKKEESKL